jgi:hypothetical protein
MIGQHLSFLVHVMALVLAWAICECRSTLPIERRLQTVTLFGTQMLNLIEKYLNVNPRQLEVLASAAAENLANIDILAGTGTTLK